MRERISLVTEETLKEESLRDQIIRGAVTKEIYDNADPETQKKIKELLFQIYAEPVDTPSALSALEFAVFGMAKLFVKCADTSKLTTEEIAFFDEMKNLVERHEITMNAGDWYVSYIENAMLKTQQNRELYKEQKLAITGTF